jgi:subtilisin family serine protease
MYLRQNWLSILTLSSLLTQWAIAGEWLVKLRNPSRASETRFMTDFGGTLEEVSRAGSIFKWSTPTDPIGLNLDGVEYIEPNRVISIPELPGLAETRESGAFDAIVETLHGQFADGPAYPDNPDFKTPGVETSGLDPLLSKAWGMKTVGAATSWTSTPSGKDIIVAVTDTGVDYNHQDLLQNIWRNPNEILDGKDNDGNGFIDDIVGWDFATNDNKPYDLSLSLMDILLSGGNPGHGTHVAGVIGARLNNALGTAGVAPNVKIMALRFLTEKGQGTTEGGIKCIDYAAANGARIINASWGGEAGEEEEDKALKESIERAQAKGVLFMAAAGNGRITGGKPAGFNNDTDKKPTLPVSYALDNIVGVAATDIEDKLANFSNFGEKTTALAAPGVNILSTVPGDRYQDTILNLFGTKITWDGTSMATPYVAGAAAVLWSQNLRQDYRSVKSKLLGAVKPVAELKGKVATAGRLDLTQVKP